MNIQQLLTIHYLEETEELSNRICIMKEVAVKEFHFLVMKK